MAHTPKVNIAQLFADVTNAVNRSGARALVELEQYAGAATEVAGLVERSEKVQAELLGRQQALRQCADAIAGHEQRLGTLRTELAETIRLQQAAEADLVAVQAALTSTRAELAAVETQRDELAERVAAIHARLMVGG